MRKGTRKLCGQMGGGNLGTSSDGELAKTVNCFSDVVMTIAFVSCGSIEDVE